MTLSAVLVGLCAICGSAIAVFLLTQERNALTGLRHHRRELPPETRRQNVRNLMVSLLAIMALALLMFLAYRWGSTRWSTSMGAALAILLFAVTIIAFTVGAVIAARRDARGDRGKREHSSPV